jgi:hypothetical protein
VAEEPLRAQPRTAGGRRLHAIGLKLAAHLRATGPLEWQAARLVLQSHGLTRANADRLLNDQKGTLWDIRVEALRRMVVAREVTP